MEDIKFEKRRKKIDKSKDTYNKYGKYSSKNIRIKDKMLENNKNNKNIENK
jgi:hypothetical protein